LRANVSLPTFTEVLSQEQFSEPLLLDASEHFSSVIGMESEVRPSRSQGLYDRAERQWLAAIAALEHILVQLLAPKLQKQGDWTTAQCWGLVMTGPLPIISHPMLLNILRAWNFTSAGRQAFNELPGQLPSGEPVQPLSISSDAHSVPLLADDPLTRERLCLVLTSELSLAMVLGQQPDGTPQFQFSCDPVTVLQAWQTLHQRIQLRAPQHFEAMATLAREFTPVLPDCRVISQFSRLLLHYFPDADVQPRFISTNQAQGKSWTAETVASRPTPPIAQDVELLQAIAHEVRTPLATIRTLTRLLLKRKGLQSDISRYLENIDRECTEQIDRFSLLFQVAELETTATPPSSMALTSTSVGELFQQGLSRWHKQASRRCQTLQIQMPQQMPTVVSNPTLLDQALTSLIEQFTGGLPTGSQIQMQVSLAGNQLKLQLQSTPTNVESETQPVKRPMLRALGQLLMFQPETGNLSLNLSVTKNLFQALGGKLIVRERPNKGEALTIYLPLY
jgi:signal transduction histidine kinase